MNWLKHYLDTNPCLRPYYLMLLRRSTKTINKWHEKKFIKGVMDCYERHCGYRFDLNNPKTFNEKLQWYKVYYVREDFERITDKALFKNYIKEKLGESYIVPMYGVWEDVNDLLSDWSNLPNEFVIKSNLMANNKGVMIVHNKEAVNLKLLKKTLRNWLNPYNTLVNSWDCHFYCGTPKILAEKYMEDEYGELRDYKFFCFDGDVPYFRVDYGRKSQHHATFFNERYEELDISVPSFPKSSDVTIALPKNINEMMSIAQQLSVGFPFIRVDFFCCNEKAFLSEMTFAPGGGVTPYPQAFNEELGRRFKLPTNEMNSKNITETTRMGGGRIGITVLMPSMLPCKVAA